MWMWMVYLSLYVGPAVNWCLVQGVPTSICQPCDELATPPSPYDVEIGSTPPATPNGISCRKWMNEWKIEKSVNKNNGIRFIVTVIPQSLAIVECCKIISGVLQHLYVLLTLRKIRNQYHDICRKLSSQMFGLTREDYFSINTQTFSAQSLHSSLFNALFIMWFILFMHSYKNYLDFYINWS